MVRGYERGRDQKQNWYNQMKEKGLKVKFALDDNDVIGGMIQYIPIEHSMFDGEESYMSCFASGSMAISRDGVITGKAEWGKLC